MIAWASKDAHLLAIEFDSGLPLLWVELMINVPSPAYVALAVFVSSWGAVAEPVKDDFRGLKTGMSRDEAQHAAYAHGGQCTDMSQSTVGAAQLACSFANESRAVLYFTPRGHVTRIRVVFAGDFDELEMQKYIIRSYKLSSDPLSSGLFQNGSASRFTFSRMGGDKYVLEIFNHKVALKDSPEPKARLPQL